MSGGYYMLEVPFDINFATRWWTFDFKTCEKAAVVEDVSFRIDYQDAKNFDRGVLLVRDKGNVTKASHLQTVLIVRGERGLSEIPDEAGRYVGSFRAQGHGWLVFLLRPGPSKSSRPLPRVEAPTQAVSAPKESEPKRPPSSGAEKPPSSPSPQLSESEDPFGGLPE